MRKWIYTTTALSLILQQLLPVYAMEQDESFKKEESPLLPRSAPEKKKSLIPESQVKEQGEGDFSLRKVMVDLKKALNDPVTKGLGPDKILPPLSSELNLSHKSAYLNFLRAQRQWNKYSVQTRFSSPLQKQEFNNYSSFLVRAAKRSWVEELPSEIATSQQDLLNLTLKSVGARPEPLISFVLDLRSSFSETDIPEELKKRITKNFPALINKDPSYPFLPHDFLQKDDTSNSELKPEDLIFELLNEKIEFLKALESFSAEETKFPVRKFPPMTAAEKNYMKKKNLSFTLASVRERYSSFVKEYCSSLPSKRGFFNVVPIASEFFTISYVIPKEMAYHLLAIDEFGRPNPHLYIAGGSHILTKEEDIYLKRNFPRSEDSNLNSEITEPLRNIDPSMEWGMSAFHRLLFDNDALVLSCLLVLPRVPLRRDPPNVDELVSKCNSLCLSKVDLGSIHEEFCMQKTRAYVAQVTPKLEGAHLDGFLEEDSENLNKLDVSHLHSLILSSFFLNFSDCKGNNLMVIRKNGKVIGFDNDWALASMIVTSSAGKASNIGEKAELHYIEARNILFSLKKYMQDMSLDEKVKTRFLEISRNFPLFLSKWLRALQHHNQCYQSLLDQGLLSLEDFETHLLPFKLKEGTLKKMLFKMRIAANYISEHRNCNITLQQIFEEIYPLAGRYYKIHIQNHGPKNFHEIMYSNNRKEENALEIVLKDTEIKCKDKTYKLQDLLDKEKTPAEDYKQRDQSLESARNEVFENTTFEEFKDQEMYKEVKQHFPIELLRSLIEINASKFPTIHRILDLNSPSSSISFTYLIEDLKYLTNLNLQRVFKNKDVRPLMALPYLLTLNLADNDLGFLAFRELCAHNSLTKLDFQRNKPIDQECSQKLVKLILSKKTPFKLLMIDPIDEEVKIDPFNQTLLFTVKSGEKKGTQRSAFRKIRTKFFQSNNCELRSSNGELTQDNYFPILHDILTYLEQEKISFEVESGEDLYQMGLLYLDPVMFVKVINFVPKLFGFKPIIGANTPYFYYRNNFTALEQFEKSHSKGYSKASKAIEFLAHHGIVTPSKSESIDSQSAAKEYNCNIQ